MFDRLFCVTPASGTVVTADQVKSHLRIDFADDDSDIGDYIKASEAWFNGPFGIGVALLPQTWRLTLDSWAELQNLRFPMHPVTAVSEITYFDLGGTVQTLDPSLYLVDLDSYPVRLTRAYGAYWPPIRPQYGAIKVTFEAGWQDATHVPSDLVHGIKALAGHYYRNRTPVAGIESRDTPTELDYMMAGIRARYSPAMVR